MNASVIVDTSFCELRKFSMGYVFCMEDKNERKDDFWHSTVNEHKSPKLPKGSAKQQWLEEKLKSAEIAWLK